MNALIRVIQSAQHDIILSRIAALLWCHCWAFNASVIANTSNMACSQKRWALSVGRDALFDFRLVERKEKKIISLKKKKKYSFLIIFCIFQLGVEEQELCIYCSSSLSFLVFFMHCSFSNFAECVEWLRVKQVSFRDSGNIWKAQILAPLGGKLTHHKHPFTFCTTCCTFMCKKHSRTLGFEVPQLRQPLCAPTPMQGLLLLL